MNKSFIGIIIKTIISASIATTLTIWACQFLGFTPRLSTLEIALTTALGSILVDIHTLAKELNTK